MRKLTVVLLILAVALTGVSAKGASEAQASLRMDKPTITFVHGYYP